MKRYALFLFTAAFLFFAPASGAETFFDAPLPEDTPPVPVQQFFAVTAESRLTPTPMPSPTPSPTPVPTPAGLIGRRYKVFSEGGEERGEDFYRSENISITVRHETDSEHYKNYIEYHVADIYLQDVTLLRTGCAGESFSSAEVDKVPDMAKKYGAVIAVSGDYYSENPGLVVRNGITYSRSTKKMNSRDVCAIYKDGSVRTFTRGKYSVADILEGDPWQVFNFGPSLLDENGKAMSGIYLGKNANNMNPRCLLGYYEPGHYALVVIDGRDREGSLGLDIDDLSRFTQDRGFKAAYNLDGGNSAAMCWEGELYSQPSAGGRSISDILYIAPEGGDVNAEPAETGRSAE